MAFVEGFVVPVPTANKDTYRAFAETSARYFRRHGALNLTETWEADVADGEVTSFPLAVKRQPGESIVFSWITWPDKATRDAAYPKVMEDMEADGHDMSTMPFDGSRMIFGGFETLVEVGAGSDTET